MLMLAGFGAKGLWVGVELGMATTLVIDERGEEDGIWMSLFFVVWVMIVPLVPMVLSPNSAC